MSVTAASRRLLLTVLTGLLAASAAGQRGGQQPSAAEVSELRRGPCQRGWTLAGRHCLRLSPEPASAADAGRLCAEHGPQTRLASLDAGGEVADLVRALWREQIRQQPAARTFAPAVWVRLAAGQQAQTREQRKARIQEAPSAKSASPAAAAVSSGPDSVTVESGPASTESATHCAALETLQVAAGDSDAILLACQRQLYYACQLNVDVLNEAEMSI